MSTVLYRKYRPESFDDLLGQNHIKTILKEIVSSGNIPHAFLFSGPRGTGKTTTARLLARAINGIEDDSYEDAVKTTDIVEMDAASNRGIEEIKLLKETIGFMPTSLEKKIYIIDEVHMLTREAFNALLKTLEEPPKHVIFIMATTEPHKLPVTILSRVQRHDFKLGSKEDVLSKLNKIVESEGFSFDQDALEIIYRVSGGSYRDAESTLAKILQSVSKDKVTGLDVGSLLGIVSIDTYNNIITAIQQKNATELSSILSELEEINTNWELFLNEFIRYVHSRITDNKESLYSLFNTLIKVSKDSRYFDQKKILIEVSLLGEMNGFIPTVNDSKEASSKVLDKTPQVSNHKSASKPVEKKVVVKESKAIPVVESKPVAVSEAKSALLESVGDENRRLKAILLTSDVEIKDSKCIIRNEYSFNIKYLEKNEVQEFMRTVLAKSGYNVDTFDFENIKSAGEKNEIDSPAPNKAQQKSKQPAKVDEASKDNSELVESLF